MTRVRSLRRREAELLAGLEGLLRRPRRGGLAGFAWRWRYELALVAGATATIMVLLRAVGAEGTVLTLSALVGLLGPWPPWHARVAARAWCVITPHRLRAGFAQARIQSREGRLPVVVRTTRAPCGERVRVWCPAGTTAEDIRAARDILRAACWAADVAVRRDERHAQLVTLDVIRRGPRVARAASRPADGSQGSPPDQARAPAGGPPPGFEAPPPDRAGVGSAPPPDRAGVGSAPRPEDPAAAGMEADETAAA